MNIDLSLTITGVIAIVSLISPALTTIINNRYLFKIKKMDEENKRISDNTERIRLIFENYCQSLSKVVIRDKFSSETLIEYASCYGKAVLYMNPNQSMEAEKIYSLIHSKDLTNAFPLAIEHIDEISNLLRKSHIISR